MSSVEIGDIVILTNTEESKLEPYIGTRWKVQSIYDTSYPTSALITKDDMQATVHIKNLDVVPPPDGIFEYGETVKIIKTFSKVNHRNCNKSLIGKFGRIKNYDSKIDYYMIRSNNGEVGWFPPSCLVPIDFKGNHFFYPFQQVKYKGKITVIGQIRRTKLNFGQLLLIDGQWIPSTEVEPL